MAIPAYYNNSTNDSLTGIDLRSAVLQRPCNECVFGLFSFKRENCRKVTNYYSFNNDTEPVFFIWPPPPSHQRKQSKKTNTHINKQQQQQQNKKQKTLNNHETKTKHHKQNSALNTFY